MDIDKITDDILKEIEAEEIKNKQNRYYIYKIGDTLPTHKYKIGDIVKILIDNLKGVKAEIVEFNGVTTISKIPLYIVMTLEDCKLINITYKKDFKMSYGETEITLMK